MLDVETNELTFNVATGEKGAALREIRLPVGKGIAGWVAEHKEPLLVPDAYADPRFNREADKMSGFQTRSILCVPLMIQERILGVVQVLNPRGRESFAEGDRRVFTSFADQAAIAVENTRLYEEIKQRAEELREALERERWLTIQRDKLGKYVPKTVVEEIERDREQALAGETRTIECSVLFSMIISIRGWNSMTELMAAATWLRATPSAKLRSRACSASETWPFSPWMAQLISPTSEDCRWISFRASVSCFARASFSVSITCLRVSCGGRQRGPSHHPNGLPD